MGKEMSTSQDFANFVCGPRLLNRYLMQVFRHMQREWQRLMAGSTHQTVYMPVFEQLQVLLPPIKEQEFIAQVAERFDASITAEARNSEATRDLRATLCHALLSGQVRVPVPSP